MSTSTTFKTKNPDAGKPEVIPAGKEPVRTTQTDDIPVPYSDYESKSGYPYLVEYFGLGDGWNERQGGFEDEINSISGYIDEQIKSGELANSTTAVKKILKDMEKVNNLKDEERVFVKTEVLASYVEFMKKKNDTFDRVRKYASS